MKRGRREEEKEGAENGDSPQNDNQQDAENEVEIKNDDVSTYEQQRAERIRRNFQRMQTLELPQLSAQISAPSSITTTDKVVVKRIKKKADSSNAPLRRSSRVRGEKPDGQFAKGLDDDLVETSYKVSSAFEEPKKQILRGDLEFKSSDDDHQPADESIISSLKETEKPRSSSELVDCSHLANISLDASLVAKVLPNGCVHAGFSPRNDAVILAAADKQGSIGFWKPPLDGNGSEEDTLETRLSVVKAHSSYVAGIKWLDCRTFLSSSYDGSVRLLDVHQNKLTEVVFQDDREFSALETITENGVILTGDNDGEVCLWDIRMANKSNSPITSFQAVSRGKINTISACMGKPLISVSTKEKVVQIWDRRKLPLGSRKEVEKRASEPFAEIRMAPLVGLTHGKGSQSALFNPDGSGKILTVSYDDTVRVWDCAKALQGGGEEMLRISHNNMTGRYISPFRPIWTPAGDGFLVGSMNRTFEVFSIKKKRKAERIAAFSHELLTAIPARNAIHPFQPLVAACTGSGRVHICQSS